jgi:hypothetical protein
VVQSLGSKIMAVLIALIFLGATAQCNTVCAQTEKHVPPCHKHATTCVRAPLTAERTATAAIPVPVIAFLPASFVPVMVKLQPTFHPTTSASPFKRTVLLI